MVIPADARPCLRWIWFLLLNAHLCGAGRVQIRALSTGRGQEVNDWQTRVLALGSFVQEHALHLRGSVRKQAPAHSTSRAGEVNVSWIRPLEWASFVQENALHLQGSATKYSLLFGPLDSLSLFDWFCLLYAALAIGLFIFDIILRNPRLDAELANRDTEINQMTGNYNGMVESMGAQLQAMVDTNLNLVEGTFRDNQRDFLKFLRHIKDRKDLFDSGQFTPEDVNNFQQFVQHWLTLFRECSPDPVAQPNSVFWEDGDDDAHSATKPSIATLHGMNTFTTVAEHTYDHLKECQVQFLSLDSGSAGRSGGWRDFAAKLTPRASFADNRGRTSTEISDINDSVTQEPPLCSWIDCCGLNPGFHNFAGSVSPYPRTVSFASCSITFLTPRHLQLVLGFFAGPALISLQLVLRNNIFVVLLISAQVALLILLVRFERTDDLARLTIECEKLRLQEEAVAHQASEVAEFFEKVALYSEVWRHRAAPRLGLMKALHLKLHEFPEHVPQLLDCFAHGLKKLDADCGSLGFWLSDGKPSSQASKFFGERVDMCASYAERIEPEELLLKPDNVFQAIRAVKVQVLGAAHLPYGGFLDKVDPYVKVRVASCAWQRTKTMSNKCNPKWDEAGNPPEFVFYMDMEDTCLEFEVMDEDLATADELMGFSKTRFDTEVMRSSSKTGDWKAKHVRLRRDDMKKLNKDASIEIKIQFATDMNRLAAYMRNMPLARD